MNSRKLMFYIVLVLFGTLIAFGLLSAKGSIGGLIFTSTVIMATGVWILLRRRIIGRTEVAAVSPAQPFSTPSSLSGVSQPAAAEGTQRTVPIVRREKNFIIEENLEALAWPQECCWCGSQVETFDSIKLKEKFKGIGLVQTELTGIPYCKGCGRRARTIGRVNNTVIILALIIGIALTIFAKTQGQSGASGSDLPWWLAFLVCFAIGYGIAWILIKLPFKLLLGKRLVEPVTAWFIEEYKSNGKQGVCVSVSIPQKGYADKFAQLNVTAATSSIPAREVDDETVINILQPSPDKPVSEFSFQSVEQTEGINLLIECLRDDIIDASDLWKRSVRDLQTRGEEGSRALAILLSEMLRCRAEKIGIAIAMSRHLVPTQELITILQAVATTNPLTSSFFNARFRPQIEGGGMIGWTDGTAARIKASAVEAIEILEKLKPA